MTFTDLTAVRRTEAALRRSEENYRRLFESMDEGFCVIDVLLDDEDNPHDFRLVEVNPAFERQTGLVAAVGRTMREMVPRHEQRWFDIYGRVALSGEPERFEGEAAALGRWFHVHAFRVGEPRDRRVAVLFRETSERRRIEKALRDSERRLGAFVTASSDTIYRMNPDWTSMSFLDGRGFMPDTRAPSDRWMERYIPPEDQEHVRAEIDRSIAAKTTFALEHRVLTVSGGLGWTASRAVPILDEAGEIVEWFGTATDITDLHEAIQALRDAERRQQELIEGVPQLVWRAVDGGEWTWASPQWTRYTDQPEPDSHGWGWLEPLHPEDREGARAAWAEADAEGGVDIEYRIRQAADGAYRWFRTRAVPVRDEHGKGTEWLGTSTDVDETRSLQEVLVAELQHRVRNMLTVIRLVFAQTVASGADLDEVAIHFKGRLDALARTQVIVTRSAEGTADLGDLIRDELLSVGASEGPGLRIEGPDVALPSKTAESIGLAIHELTTNAIKYGALKTPGGTLTIRWSTNVDQGDARRITLTWIEQGVPAVATTPTREGFGRELIEEALPYRLGAATKLEFLGGGVRCSISVPLIAGQAEPGSSED